MKKTSKIEKKISKTVVAICIATTAGWMTVQAQAQDPAINQPETQRAQTTTEPGQPQRLNKMSELIGSKVENPQGDKLGKIEEVVVDLHNGKVSYCVMSVEHSLFSTPKYLAVPLAAFQPSEDGTYLILNADKNKVAQAQGFSRDNWPAVNNPTWGAQPFWETTPKATIAPPDEQKNSPPATVH